MTTSEELCYSWWLEILQRKFATQPVPEVSLLLADPSSWASDEDLTLLWRFLLLFLIIWHYFINWLSYPHLKKAKWQSRDLLGGILQHLAHAGAHLSPCVTLPWDCANFDLKCFGFFPLYALLFLGAGKLEDDGERPFCFCWKDEQFTLPFCWPDSLPVLAILYFYFFPIPQLLFFKPLHIHHESLYIHVPN